MVPSRDEAFRILLTVGAPVRLVRHVELVGEAGEQLLEALGALGVAVDGPFVRAGIVLHDVGKTLHPSELSGPGEQHEASGERLLLERGVDPKLARVCRSHAQWRTMDCSLEELVIALADKLWKGVRTAPLEETVIDRVAASVGCSRWDVFVPLDSVFEATAAEGDRRLARSQAG
jgi:hypothetical protein